MQFSSTQLANISSMAGLLVILANQMGLVWDTNTVAFVIGAIWSIGATCYSFYNRYSKGDLTLGGVRK